MNCFLTWLVVGAILALAAGRIIGKMNPLDHGGPLPTDEDREFIIGDQNGKK